MRALLENPLWRLAGLNRKYQRLFGAISGVFLLIALISLFDGLIAQMRQGANELEFLPGQALTLSGPVALKNPVNSDVLARFTPADAPFHFELEGFFTGYWFGNGMWRGAVIADNFGETGEYGLRISFKGAPAQSAQQYKLLLFADAAAMRADSLSWIRRYFDLNPFILAAFSGFIGILGGIATYWFGRRFGNLLSRLGLAEVYATDPATASISCLVPIEQAPRPGLARLILDADGHSVAEARTGSWHKGRLTLTLMDGREIPAGALVCLRHPDFPASQ